jgi:hypothetical protein
MVLQTNSPKEANEMLTKTRTALIALVASVSFAAASTVPAVSSARPIKKGTTAVTCPDINGAGTGQPGESRTLSENIILPNGKWGIRSETKICGNDGKWHTVVDLVVGGTVPVAPVGVLSAAA